MTDCPKSMRIAIPKDEENIFSILCDLWEENGMMPMNPEKVRTLIKKGTREKEGIIGIIQGPKEIEAIIAIVPSSFWYATALHAEEFFSYVRPEYRRSNHAKELIQFAKHVAEQLDMPLVMGILSNERTEAKIRLYQRHIHHCGAIFIHNLKKEDKIGVM